MAKLKKGQRGNATNYVTRRKALQKLQLSLADFRRLCILKGIFPRDPKKKSEGPLKTYYLAKDIQFLAHEPLVDKFREMRSHRRKLVRAKARNEPGVVKTLMETQPTYQLDHIVRERYPQFNDALRDLDDALCMLHLFAAFPAVGKVNSRRVRNCARLCGEFQHFVMKTHALKKVFASIKGIYFQVEVQNEVITWLDPYKFAQKPPRDVDFRVMLTFLEFYESLLAFVNFRLYTLQGLVYPPALMSYESAGSDLARLESSAKSSSTSDYARVPKKSSLSKSAIANAVRGALDKVSSENDASADVENIADDDADDGTNCQLETVEEPGDGDNDEEGRSLLFSGFVFFLCRETPVSALDFVIKSMGGKTGWEGEASPFDAKDERVTHIVVDRPKVVGAVRMDVEYIQPQWVLDCVNAEALLPVPLYTPGAVLPPHLSPFVDDEEEGYEPAYKNVIQRIKNNDPEVVQETALMFAKNAEAMNDVKTTRSGDNNGRSDSPEGIDGGIDDDAKEDAVVEEEEKEEEEQDVSSDDDSVGRSNDAEQSLKSKKRGSSRREAEEKELRKMMMSRKHRKLYDTIHRGKQRRSKQLEKVIEKRRAIDQRKRTSISAGRK